MSNIKLYISKLHDAPEPVKAAFWFTICSIVNKCIQLITVPIFTRLLSTAEYGEYSIFVSWQNILLIIATLNIYSNVFNNGMIKYADRQDKFLSSMQGLTTAITIAIILLFLTLKKSISDFIGLPPSLILILLVEIMLTPGYELWAAKQRFDFKYKKVVATTLLLLVLNPIVGLFFVHYANEKGYARILSVLIVQIGIYGYIYINNLKKDVTFFNKEFWRYALFLAIPLIPHYISQTLLNQMDRIMISNICGISQAGIYSVAYSGAMILQIIGKSIQNSFTPWIYKKINSDKTKDVMNIVNALVMLVGVMNFLLICLAPEFITILAGSKYKEAIYVIPPVACSAYLIFLYSMFCIIEFYYEQTKPMLVISVLGAFINYIMNVFFIKKIGYYAAGYTTLFSYLFFTIAHSFIMKSALTKNGYNSNIYDMAFIWKFTILFILLGITISIFYSSLSIRYLIFILILSVFFIKRKTLLHYIDTIVYKKNM